MSLTDSYRLHTEIGEGGTGTVWAATRLGPVTRPVAVKRLRPGAGEEAANQLRREAAVLAEVDHPHVVGVLDVVDDADGVALVMPLARGGSLADLLAERGRLRPGEVVAVAAPIAEALASAHRRGLIHGDVKPSNILFTGDGEPLLADFGVARAVGADDGCAAGTAGYLAPEVEAGALPDKRSDVYSLAVTCTEALSGQPPDPAGRGAGGGGPLAPDHSVPAALAEVLDAALATDPDARCPAPSDLADRLRATVATDAVVLPGPALFPLAGQGRSAARRDTRTFGPRPPFPEPPPEPRRRWASVAPVVVVVAVVIAGALALAVRSSGRGERSPTVRPRTQPATPCTPYPPLDAPAGGHRLAADLNGDGCPVPVVFDGQVMSLWRDRGDTQPDRYRFDRRGQLVFGDWDCDGRASPALYLADTGEVVYYRELADQASEQGVAVPAGGEPRVVRNADGCDEVDIARRPT